MVLGNPACEQSWTLRSVHTQRHRTLGVNLVTTGLSLVLAFQFSADDCVYLLTSTSPVLW